MEIYRLLCLLWEYETKHFCQLIPHNLNPQSSAREKAGTNNVVEVIEILDDDDKIARSHYIDLYNNDALFASINIKTTNTNVKEETNK